MVSLAGVPDPVYPFLALAALMIVFEVGLLVVFFRHGRAPRVSRAFFVSYLLASSIFFWVALPPAVLNPNLDTWTWAIQAMMLPMTAPFLWMVSLLYRANERTVRPGAWLWPGILTGSLVLNELLMAWAFVTLAPNGTDPSPTAMFAAAVNSVWFASAMLASMTAVLVRLPLGRGERIALGGLAASVLAAPWITTAPVLAGGIMTAVMAATFGLLLWSLVRRRSVSARASRVVIGVAGGFAIMAAGALASFFVAASALAGFPFALATLVVMAAEMFFILQSGTRMGAPQPGAPTPLGAKAPAGTYLR